MKKFLGLFLGILLLFSVGSANASIMVEIFSSSPTPMDSLADADAAMLNSADYKGVYDLIDFYDGLGPDGNFNINNAFNITPLDDFALHATGHLIIETTGSYTFGTNNDDGLRLNIDGGVAEINDDSLHNNRNFFATMELTAGVHSFDLVFFERGGGASVEFFTVAANGSYQLVGSEGGIQTAPVPEPATMMLFGIGLLGLAGVSRRKRS